MRLPKQVVRIVNAVTKLALLVGIPRPPYTRENALIVETVGPSISIRIELYSPTTKSYETRLQSQADSGLAN